MSSYPAFLFFFKAKKASFNYSFINNGCSHSSFPYLRRYSGKLLLDVLNFSPISAKYLLEFSATELLLVTLIVFTKFLSGRLWWLDFNFLNVLLIFF